MKYIGFDREEDAELWARKRLGIDAPPSFFRAMSAVDDDGEFVCVVVLTNFNAFNIDVNIVIDAKKMRPKETIVMYNEVFGFLFDKLKVKRLTGLTRESNAKARNLNPQFGFKLEGTMRKAYNGEEDLLVYGMLPEEYHNHKWYRHGT